MKRVLIFQNYHTPYRHALFDALVERGLDLTVAYMHRPEDEGRQWRPPPLTDYRSVNLPHLHVGRVVLFWVPRRLRTKFDEVLLLDNNPTNLAMIIWAAYFRIGGMHQLLWVEHIPDRYKGRLKTAFQRVCTRCLIKLSEGILAFSEMTRCYIAELNVSKPVHRMVQATPSGTYTRRQGRLTRFGYLGSNQPRKNIANLIEAFGQIAVPELELHIAGFENDFADPRVVQHGYVDGETREAFFRSIDVLILPSLADPWGLVVNEAVDRGCLAIASENCGSDELVREIDAELICGVEIEDIKSAIVRCISFSAARVDELRNRAAATIGKFSISSAADHLLAATDWQADR